MRSVLCVGGPLDGLLAERGPGGAIAYAEQESSPGAGPYGWEHRDFLPAVGPYHQKLYRAVSFPDGSELAFQEPVAAQFERLRLEMRSREESMLRRLLDHNDWLRRRLGAAGAEC